MPPAKLHRVDPSLTRLLVPLTTLTPHPENYRRGNVDLIASSLERFGQVRPIVVQKSTSLIVAGNHTYKAAAHLGWTHIAAALVELEDDDARAYLVADNRSSDLAENDDAALAAILEQLSDQGKLEGTGFDADAVDDLLQQLAQLPVNTPDENPEVQQVPPDVRAQRIQQSHEDAKHGAGPMPHREVVLVLTAEQADQFGKDVKRLQAVYETTGTAATILRAVAAAVKVADARVAQ